MGAIIFYLIFTTVYGLMNWLVYYNAASSLALTSYKLAIWRVWCLLMVFAPAITGLTGNRTGIIASITYVWLGLAFYLFLGAIIILPFKFAGKPALVRWVFIVLTSVSVIACGYGFYHARNPVISEIKINSQKIDLKYNPLRIAVISDVHLHSVEAETRLERIITALNSVEYDMLISLGDLIESGIHKTDWQGLAETFTAVKPKLGKYAINGNHELYSNMSAGMDISRKFHTAAGFQLLTDQKTDVAYFLTIVGLADRGRGTNDFKRELDLLHEVESGRFTLLLKHGPSVNTDSLGLFDLMLSGHTHNGQIWPFNYIVEKFFPYINGLYKLQRNSLLYTSPGTGTWGPPIRVRTTPEITIINITRPDE